MGGELMSPRIGVSERPPVSAIPSEPWRSRVGDPSVAEDYTVGAAQARVYADGRGGDDNCLIDIHGSTCRPRAALGTSLSPVARVRVETGQLALVAALIAADG